jgi:hypothetical protein
VREGVKDVAAAFSCLIIILHHWANSIYGDTYIHTYINTYITYTHTYIHTYIHTYTHTHTYRALHCQIFNMRYRSGHLKLKTCLKVSSPNHRLKNFNDFFYIEFTTFRQNYAVVFVRSFKQRYFGLRN